MRFDLVDLALFLHIHEAGTITAGAARSHMTLASASERIRDMETALGVPLLLRERRGVRATEAGRTLAHHARLVLRQMACLRDELGEYGGGLKGHVRLQCNTATLSEFLPEALSRFLADHPRVSIDLEERASADIVAALRGGFCDIGLVSDAEDLHGLHSVVLRPDPLVLIVPRQHPLAAAREVRLADVADHDFVGLLENTALQTHLAQQARRLGKVLHYRIRLGHVDSICRMVGKGIGVAVVPRASARRHTRTAAIKAIKLHDTWAQRQLVLCVRQLDSLPPCARQLVEHLRLGAPAGEH